MSDATGGNNLEDVNLNLTLEKPRASEEDCSTDANSPVPQDAASAGDEALMSEARTKWSRARVFFSI